MNLITHISTSLGSSLPSPTGIGVGGEAGLIGVGTVVETGLGVGTSLDGSGSAKNVSTTQIAPTTSPKSRNHLDTGTPYGTDLGRLC